MLDIHPLPRLAYSAKEAAAMLNISYATVLGEIRAGRLAARKTGKEYRIHRDVLDDYLKCPTQGSRSVSKWFPGPATGVSSDGIERKAASGYEERLLGKLRSKHVPMN